MIKEIAVMLCVYSIISSIILVYILVHDSVIKRITSRMARKYRENERLRFMHYKSSYALSVKRWTYFTSVSSDGELVEEPSFIEKKITFSTNDTALFIIDPWVEGYSEAIVKSEKNILEQSIIPLAKLMLETGHRVYVFTNEPKLYPSKIHPELENIAGIEIIYNQLCSTVDIAKDLRRLGIRNIVFSGFQSNMCILNRPSGLLNLYYNGKYNFNYFLMPEAMHAVISKNEADNDQFNNNLVKTLSAIKMAEIINVTEYFNVLSDLSKNKGIANPE